MEEPHFDFTLWAYLFITFQKMYNPQDLQIYTTRKSILRGWWHVYLQIWF